MLEFLSDLEQERGFARNTIDAYRSDLVQLGAFLAHRRRDALAVEHTQLAAFLHVGTAARLVRSLRGVGSSVALSSSVAGEHDRGPEAQVARPSKLSSSACAGIHV